MDVNLFEGDYYLILMIIVISSTSGIAEGGRINDRIDLLAKLVKNNAFQDKNILDIGKHSCTKTHKFFNLALTWQI